MEKNEHLPFNSTAPQTSLNAKLPFYCLIAVGIMNFLLMVMGDLWSRFAYCLINGLFIIPCMLILGSACARGLTRSAKRNLCLCLAVVAWFVIVQFQRGYCLQLQHGYWLAWDTRMIGLYLMAFPFAAITRDDETGLKMIAKIYIAASLVFAVYAAMLLLNCLPSFLKQSVFWMGARLLIFRHPNIVGSVLMVGIGFCIFLWLQAEDKWKKWLLAIVFILLFMTLTLTNSRTCIIITCALVGGVVFFSLYKDTGGWKRFVIGAVAALAVMLSLFLATNILWKVHNNFLISQYTAQQAEQVQQPEHPSEDAPALSIVTNNATGELELTGGGQGSLENDFWTFNGRLGIWKAALPAIRTHKSILIWGSSNISETLSEFYGHIAHSHNSWLEVLLGYGLLGLLIGLIFTWLAVRNAISLLWNKNQALWKKAVALLTLCLLLEAFLEPFLFFATIEYHYIDFVFLLCIGYTSHWRALEKAQGKQA